MIVALQVIKVYHVEVDSVEQANAMTSLEIAEDGKLIDVTTDFIEVVDEDEDDEDE